MFKDFMLSDLYTLSLGLFITGCLMYVVWCLFKDKDKGDCYGKERD